VLGEDQQFAAPVAHLGELGLLQAVLQRVELGFRLVSGDQLVGVSDEPLERLDLGAHAVERLGDDHALDGCLLVVLGGVVNLLL
jgi:hypothetical protein